MRALLSEVYDIGVIEGDLLLHRYLKTCNEIQLTFNIQGKKNRATSRGHAGAARLKAARRRLYVAPPRRRRRPTTFTSSLESTDRTL